METIFRDRLDAADAMIRELADLRGSSPLILGVPRGAVPMAKHIADELGGDLDIVLVHKVGHPFHPEFAVGAVTEEGEIILGDGGRRSGLSLKDIEPQAAREIEELKRKRQLLTPHRGPIDPRGRTVVIVDDGIATGATMAAAVRSLQLKGAARIIVSAPVASRDAVEHLIEQGAEVRVVAVPELFMAVSQFFDVFDQVTDEEAADALSQAQKDIEIENHDIALQGILTVPDEAKGIVIFAHGSGSGRHSPRNQYVASVLNEAGFATLLADLLTEEEFTDRKNVFDIGLLGKRVGLLIKWCKKDSKLSPLPLGLFGASTGAAAALRAAADFPFFVQGVVSRGGRPDLADESLPLVRAPTLLIVGGDDRDVIELNRWSFDRMSCEKNVEVVPGATHLFEEPGALERVAELATDWFKDHLIEVATSFKASTSANTVRLP